MPIAYVNEEGTDIEVEVIEFMGKDRARVVAVAGHPFGKKIRSNKSRLLERCTSNTKVVNKAEIRVVS